MYEQLPLRASLLLAYHLKWHRHFCLRKCFCLTIEHDMVVAPGAGLVTGASVYTSSCLVIKCCCRVIVPNRVDQDEHVAKHFIVVVFCLYTQRLTNRHNNNGFHCIIEVTAVAIVLELYWAYHQTYVQKHQMFKVDYSLYIGV